LIKLIIENYATNNIQLIEEIKRPIVNAVNLKINTFGCMPMELRQRTAIWIIGDNAII